MARVTGEQRPEYFRFASKQLNEHWEHGPHCKCLANLSDDGSILGVVIYDQINEFNCLMHVASNGSRRFVTKEFLAWTFKVPFEQWGLTRVTGLVAANNEQALAFDRGLGFVQEGVIRRAFGDVDGILFGMLKEDCRYLTIKVK
ncbi:MAG: hypothetical protein CML17_02255 [Pusillimonas sp.]|jgi:L-amino acid N-acyltransferase YncA|nr:hypothetical protein [Pusillimonas sp.]|tara:strand:- start:20 stop:451 length:432 start_codon:yes stop_codon:yes gene_type:complete